MERAVRPLPIILWPFIGAASALGFQPDNFWPVSLMAFALLMMDLPRMGTQRAFWTGWLFGLGHFAYGLRWIAVAFNFQAAMPHWMGYAAVVALSLYLALFPAVAAWSARLIANRDRPFVLAVAMAGTWIITEYLRAQLFTGFAWNPLAVLAVDASWVTRVIGTYGLSGLLILLAGGMALVPLGRWKSAGTLALMPVLLLTVGAIVYNYPPPRHSDQPIAVIQPNIGQEEKHDATKEMANFEKLALLTLDRSARRQSDTPYLIFWPEAATRWSIESGYPGYFYQDQPGGSAVATRLTLAALIDPDAVLLTGSDKLEFDEDKRLVGARNSVFALSGDADIIGSYDKAHLVPYGEYLPMQGLLTPLGLRRLVPGTLDFWPGPGPRTIDLGDGRGSAGIQICYEIVFSGEVVDASHRPNFIFNPSNDAWFGQVGPPQHLAQARLRAMEEGLPVIRSTPTGISAVIDAEGRIVESLPLGTAGRIDSFLPSPRAPGLFARMGNWAPILLALALIAASLVAIGRARR